MIVTRVTPTTFQIHAPRATQKSHRLHSVYSFHVITSTARLMLICTRASLVAVIFGQIDNFILRHRFLLSHIPHLSSYGAQFPLQVSLDEWEEKIQLTLIAMMV
jgi:hypothetical protein